MRDVVVEACAESIDDAIVADECRVERIELCTALELSGLTPPPELTANARGIFRGTIISMIRPRAGHFRSDAAEVDVMRREMDEQRDAGADGFALGVLNVDGTIDTAALRTLVVHAGNLPVVFHRAFDQAPNLTVALDALIDCGVARVLTSGGAPSALDGAAMLRALRDRANDRIEIMAGGNVRAESVDRVVREAGVRDIHARTPAIPSIVATLESGTL